MLYIITLCDVLHDSFPISSFSHFYLVVFFFYPWWSVFFFYLLLICTWKIKVTVFLVTITIPPPFYILLHSLTCSNKWWLWYTEKITVGQKIEDLWPRNNGKPRTLCIVHLYFSNECKVHTFSDVSLLLTFHWLKQFRLLCLISMLWVSGRWGEPVILMSINHLRGANCVSGNNSKEQGKSRMQNLRDQPVWIYTFASWLHDVPLWIPQFI